MENVLGGRENARVTTATTNPYFRLEADFSYELVEGDCSGYGAIDEFFDAVAEHLIEIEAEDATIVLDTEAQTFTVALLVASQEYESIETVLGKGMGMIRTALHSCNAHTPGWPTSRDALLRGVRIVPATIKGQKGSAPTGARPLASV